ncbi:MAG: type VI secretion system-associated FHA domain protein TagH [Deltaproteobacteria bacterium]|nr:type VI secretion system-associated FHA domain protein TagH [Candidatus Tharpella aukensis]
MVSISEPDMLLKLSVVSCSSGLSAEDATVTIGKNGGSIGRDPENKNGGSYLTLNGEDVSRTHVIISYEDGIYFLTDQSSNGTEISNKGLSLHHQKVQLDDGDKLIIGSFMIDVTLVPITSCEKQIDDSAEGSPLSWLPPINPPILDPAPTSHPPTSVPDDFDFNDIFSTPPVIPVPSEPPASSPPILSESPSLSKSPTLTESTIPSTSTSVQPAPPTPPVVSDNSNTKLLESFWKGAGVFNAPVVTEEKMTEIIFLLGEIFREMVDGLMLALKARAEQRNAIRASMTHIELTENNPLKFMPQVEDAIINMLLQDNPSYIQAVEAVREGFANLRNDQMAMHAGVQAVLNHTLAKFAPEHFAKKFEEGFVLQKKAKCWNEYCEQYPILCNQVLENVFNEIFVQAFEEQIARLRTHGTSR